MNKVIVILLLAILITLLNAWVVAAIVVGVICGLLVFFFLVGLVLHIFGWGRNVCADSLKAYLKAYNNLAFIKSSKTNKQISELRRKIEIKEGLGYDVDDLKEELKQLLTK